MGLICASPPIKPSPSNLIVQGLKVMSDSTSKNDAMARVMARGKQAGERLNKRFNQDQTHLSVKKYLQKDFFIADIFDTTTFREDIASMEYPLFSLKAGDKRTRRFELNGFKTVVAPNSEYGMATIHDKDIWIYCISKLVAAMKQGEEPNRTVHFTIYDYLVTTNRGTSGEYYEKAKGALDRLAGTRITTEIETVKIREARGFGLIDSWRIVEEKDGRMVRVSVALPEWLYRSITNKAVLKISSDYFRLRKPLDRRIYELARKHCGHQITWQIGLDVLHQKAGSTAPLRNFKIAIKSLADSNELPDYEMKYDEKKGLVIFSNKDPNALAKYLKKKEGFDSKWLAFP